MIKTLSMILLITSVLFSNESKFRIETPNNVFFTNSVITNASNIRFKVCDNMICTKYIIYGNVTISELETKEYDIIDNKTIRNMLNSYLKGNK